MHENPLVQQNGFSKHLISGIPGLKKLDSATITHSERHIVEIKQGLENITLKRKWFIIWGYLTAVGFDVENILIEIIIVVYSPNDVKNINIFFDVQMNHYNSVIDVVLNSVF